jgi:LPS-assembly protein
MMKCQDKIMFKSCLLSFGLLILLISPFEAWAAEQDDSEEIVPGQAAVTNPAQSVSSLDASRSISLEADSLVYEQVDKTYQATGKALLKQGEKELTADKLLLQTATQDTLAEGNVSYRDSKAEIIGSRLRLNLSSEQGQLQDGRIFLRQGNFRLSGVDIKKLGQSTYQVQSGSFTTCDGDIADWKFTAKKIRVHLGDYATAQHVWFYVKDTPLLYSPYVVFPVKAERESGFLMPNFGNSKEKGVMTSLAWYQVIDRNMDMTVRADYMSELGIGKGLEYRYLLGRENLGEMQYYHVNGISDNSDTYGFAWRHGGTLPGDVWLAADAQYVDDRQFFEDFGEVAEEYNQDKTVSQLWAQRNWAKLNLVGRARYIQDLEQSNDTTLQRLPELSIDLPRYRIGSSPLYGSLETLITNFNRDEGEEGRRLYLRPSLAAAFRPGSWLELVPEVALYERIYDADSPGDEKTLPEFKVTLSTRLQKVFMLKDWGAVKIQHSVEPYLTYLYRPNESEEDLPLFDLRDRLSPRNLLEYALVNRLTLRKDHNGGQPTYREIFNLRLSQIYDIYEARDDDLDEKEPFSDLRVELSVRPSTRTYLTMDNLISAHGDLEFSQFRATAGAKDEVGNGVSLNYSYRDDDIESLKTEYLSAKVDTSLLKPLYLSFEERYSLYEKRSLETYVAMEYRSQCWSLFLSYRDRLDDQAVMISFALAGLGKVGSITSSLSTSEAE